MRKFFLLFLVFSVTANAQAPSSFQFGIRTPNVFPWTGSNTVNFNGRLKLNTASGGFIPSTLTTAQRLNIQSPQTGESVYDITLGAFYHWDGTSWVQSGSATGSTNGLEETLTAGNVANNNFTLNGPSNQSGNFSAGTVQLQDGTGDNLVQTAITAESGGVSGLFMNSQRIGSAARSNTAFVKLHPDYFTTTGTRSINYNLPFKAAGTYTLATTSDITPPSLPEHQIAVGQIGNSFGSSEDLTFEGGDLRVLGSLVLTEFSGQPIDSDLTDIAALTPPNDNILQRKAGLWTSRTPAQFKTDLSLVKADVGLGNVDNTSDVNKPVSTAQQTAIDAKVQNSMSGSTTVAPSATAVANFYSNVTRNIVKDVTASTPLTGSTTEAILKSYEITGGTFSATDIINLVSARFTKTGGATNTINLRMYINTSNSLSGATQIAALTSVQGFYFKYGRTFTLRGGNILGFSATTNGGSSVGTDFGNSSIAALSAALNPANTFWIIFSGQLTVGTDSLIASEVLITN